MKFSIKAAAAQPGLSEARLYVLAEGAADKQLPSQSSSEQDALLQHLLQNLVAEGKAGLRSTWLGSAAGAAQAGLLYLGQAADYAALEKACEPVADWAKKLTATILHVDLGALPSEQALSVLSALVLAIQNGLYQYQQFKEPAEPTQLAEVHFYHPAADVAAFQAALQVAETTARAMSLAKDLGNAPGNLCTPAYLAQQAKTHAEAAGAQVNIIRGQAIEAMGMGSFWSVAKASTEEAQFIELHYQGATDATAAPVVLVGKGITFDSGGISLKPGEAMDEMKYDMCGAATVIASFCAAAELKLPLNLVALVPTCENMPGGNANKPGDIVKSLKGLTIEVLNTDAEGRLILCDALTYAERFKPQAVIDVATLTGACIIALGHVGSGLVGNNQDLIDTLLAVSREVNDKAWQMPLWDEYHEQLKSNFADLANIGGRAAGTITAAAFLSRFAEDYPWAHLDIAGTAWQSGKNKGASGRPVPLLLNYLRRVAGV